MNTESTTVTVGQFSQMTHLGAVTLRHYHDKGVLVPCEVDAVTGYRRYGVHQVDDALLLSRLRAVGLSVPDMKSIVAEPVGPRRDAELDRQLTALDESLSQTRHGIASLRALLNRPARPPVVDVRNVATLRGWAITEVVSRDDVGALCEDSFGELVRHLSESGGAPMGPAEGHYSEEFFSDDKGVVTLFVPTSHPVDNARSERIVETTITGGLAATTHHCGAYDNFDLTYSALGRVVQERFTPREGAIREVYVYGPPHTEDATTWLTEIHWPITDYTIQEKS